MAQADPKDLYAVLGVAKTATEAEIKKAYRRLAKELHPDLTGGDAAKSEQFKAVSAAYDLLRDAEKRRRYDAGEIDAEGQERAPQGFYRPHAEADASGRYAYEGSFDDLGDFFSQAFRNSGRSRGGSPFGNMKMRGSDLQFHMEIALRDAISGGTRSVTIPGVGSVEIRIPAGIEDGQTLRLAGKGQPGANGGPAGDALITISVADDPVFTRIGDDLEMELPVSLDEAVLGGAVEVDLPGGGVRLKVPANSSSGRVMRLRGKGMPRRDGSSGDLLVRLKIVLPETSDPALAEAVRNWRASHAYDPRAGWKGNRK